jgi:hypothetical protein
MIQQRLQSSCPVPELTIKCSITEADNYLIKGTIKFVYNNLQSQERFYMLHVRALDYKDKLNNN